MKAGHRSDFDRAIARYEEKVRFEAYDLNKGQYGDGKKVEQKPGTKFKHRVQIVSPQKGIRLIPFQYF